MAAFYGVVKVWAVLCAAAVFLAGCRLPVGQVSDEPVHSPVVPSLPPPLPPPRSLGRAAVVTPPKPQPQFVDILVSVPKGRRGLSTSTDLKEWTPPLVLDMDRRTVVVIRDYDFKDANRFFRISPLP